MCQAWVVRGLVPAVNFPGKLWSNRQAPKMRHIGRVVDCRFQDEDLVVAKGHDLGTI
jgi:hypothetical protein